MPFHFTIYICVHIQSDLARSLTFQLINPSVEVFVPYIWKSLPSPHIGERSQRSYRVGVNHIYGDVTVIPIIITIVHTTAILNVTSLVQNDFIETLRNSRILNRKVSHCSVKCVLYCELDSTQFGYV